MQFFDTFNLEISQTINLYNEITEYCKEKIDCKVFHRKSYFKFS